MCLSYSFLNENKTKTSTCSKNIMGKRCGDPGFRISATGSYIKFLLLNFLGWALFSDWITTNSDAILGPSLTVLRKADAQTPPY